MKKRFLQTILSGTVSMGLLAMVSCTAGFEELNRPGEKISDEELGRDNYKLQSYFEQMMENVLSPQENSFQMNESLIGDVYGRYMMTVNDGWNTTNFSIFTAPDRWVNYPFDDVMQKFITPWYQVKDATGGEGPAWALAQILRVASMHRLGDMYGALPYSQVNSETLSVPYDDMKTLYHAMLADLTDAVSELEQQIGKGNTTLLADADAVYGGKLNKWLAFANSLKLRLAMRLREVEPEYAREMAEDAVAGGVITSNADAPAYPYPGNAPVWKVCVSWGDSRASADITSYLNGYADPRLSLYVDPTTFAGYENVYAGFRSGGISTNKAHTDQYSCPVATANDSYYWMTAAEVAFLRAEGALFNWNMGSEDAETLYKEGISLSFEQWGASGAALYTENDTNTEADYVDPDNGRYSVSAPSTITIKWEANQQERNLERIITQKWIAMFPLGQEAWSEYRRTGYPKFFELPQATSIPSLPTVANRLPFNRDEYTTNPDNINASTVQALLGGADSYATKVYWAK